MLNTIAKRIIAHTPSYVQQELKRLHFRKLIQKDRFVPVEEEEIAFIARTIRPGDCVIDVGANVGHYTLHMAACVGKQGRVFAFEPLLETFALLTANVQAGGYNNVTLINAGASSTIREAKMSVPKFESSGLDNLYRAHLSDDGDRSVLCFPLDAMPFSEPIRLIKIDAEGHDLQVLKGAEQLVDLYKPMIIVESPDSGPIREWLLERGYTIIKVSFNSPNIIAVVV